MKYVNFTLRLFLVLFGWFRFMLPPGIAEDDTQQQTVGTQSRVTTTA